MLKNGRPILAVSVAGGDLQDQGTLQLLLGCIDFGMMPAADVTAPRFATDSYQDSFNPSAKRETTIVSLGLLTVNDTVSERTRDELARRGHRLKVTAGAVAAPVMLYLEPAGGMVFAAGDPAAGQHAAAAP